MIQIIKIKNFDAEVQCKATITPIHNGYEVNRRAARRLLNLLHPLPNQKLPAVRQYIVLPCDLSNTTVLWNIGKGKFVLYPSLQLRSHTLVIRTL